MTDAYPIDVQELIEDINEEWEALTGEQRLWRWFSLSRAAFCVIPRVYMHAMSEEWQEKMARLLEEYDEAVTHLDTLPFDGCRVQVTLGGKIVKTPDWLLNYRRPDPIIGTIVQQTRGSDKAADDE